MNGLDLLLLAMLGLSAVAGFRRGALHQLLSTGGLFLGLFVGALVGPPVAGLAQSPGARAGIALGSLLVSAGIGNALGWAAGSVVRARAHRTRLKDADHAGGLVVSVAAGLLAIWFIGLNLVNGPFPGLAREVRGSAIVRALDDTLPHPPSILAEARRFLDRFGFPEVFSGLPPAPSEPVPWPTQAEAESAFEAAAPSTVRIVGTACGGVQLGSGFVVNDHYVATVAHVVAGMDAPTVQAQGGESQAATTVLFDPQTDLAVLWVNGSLGPPLALASAEVERGTGGAVLGYPHGGDLEGDRAAVRRALEAVGRDIYGRHEVRREVYEIQARVEPGDSGGPFVLPDGTVAGMVFAASTIQDGVGYAIASTELLDEIASTFSLKSPVPTGACTR